jgi:hypothetical protein
VVVDLLPVALDHQIARDRLRIVRARRTDLEVRETTSLGRETIVRERRRIAQAPRTDPEVRETTSLGRETIVRERRRIVRAPRTDPEVQEITSLGHGIIGPEHRITTGQERLTTIGRKTIMLRVREEHRAQVLGPTTNRIEVQRLPVLAIRTIRMDRENHGVAKQRPARERRIIRAGIQMVRTTAIQEDRVAQTMALRGAVFRVRHQEGPIKASPIVGQTPRAEMRGQITRLRQSPGHRDPQLRTTVRLRRKIGQRRRTIGETQRLTADLLLLRTAVIRRPLRRHGKLRPLGPIEPNLLLSENHGRRRLRVSPGRKPDLPAIIRSGHLGRSNPGLKRATTTETRTTGTIRTTRTSRSSAEPFCPINQQPDFGQAVFFAPRSSSAEALSRDKL